MKLHIKQLGYLAATAIAAILTAAAPVELSAQDSDNYIRKTTYTTPDGTDSGSYTDATYYDGLGYLSEEVSSRWTSAGSGLVRPVTYDINHRQDKFWLPFASAAAGPDASFLAGATTLQASALGDARAFSQTVFEDYPDGRPLSTQREGAEWQTAGKRITYSYRLNTGGDKIHRFSYSRGTGGLSSSSVSTGGFWPEGSLKCTVTAGEDGDTTAVFSDGWGKTICTRCRVDDFTSTDTYCIYDLKDSLVCVIQPMLSDSHKDDSAFTLSFGSQDAQDYCFLWQYDGRGNVIESQTPGGGVDNYIYDQRDRLVLDSTQEMRLHGMWHHTVYDGFNRATEERYVSLGSLTVAEVRDMLLNGEPIQDELDVVRTTVSRVYYPFRSATAPVQPEEPGPSPSVPGWDFTDEIELYGSILDMIIEEKDDASDLADIYSSGTTAGRLYRRIVAAAETVEDAVSSILELYEGNDGLYADFDQGGTIRDAIADILEEIDADMDDLEDFNYMASNAGAYLERLESHAECIEDLAALAEDLVEQVDSFFSSAEPVAGGSQSTVQNQPSEQESTIDLDPFNVADDFMQEAGVTSLADLNTEHLYGCLKQETVWSVPEMSAGAEGGAVACRTTSYFYDNRGRVIQTQTYTTIGDVPTSFSIVSTKYDFCGNVLAVKETDSRYDTDGTPHSHILVTTYTRDLRGRVLTCSREFDGTVLDTVTYSYDALGRLTGKSAGGKVSETYAYDLRGWQTAMEASYDGTAIFSESLRYQDATGKKATTQPRWDGRISEAVTLHAGQQASQAYSYFYDGLGRLCDVSHYAGNTLKDNCATERDITYDLNGNITQIERFIGENNGEPAYMEYDGNHVSEIFGGGTYSYDSNGNLTENTWNCLEFSYNVLNLPCTAQETWGRQRRSLTYTYLADGTKVSAVIDGGEGLRYSGSFVYAVSADGSETLESVGWDEGRIIIGSDGTAGQDQWFVRDHLGNVRSVVDLSAPEGSTAETAVVEQSDYLPFGTRMALKTDAVNRHRYAGKEEQRFGTGSSPMDLEHLDFGARFYDPFTARWTTPDPLASKYPSISPYAYCGNDPVNKFDPDGKDLVLIGANNSSITFTTELVDLSFNLGNLGIDWNGQHTLDGDKYLSAALDIAGVFDPTGLADIANAGFQYREGDMLGAAISAVGVLPYVGDLAKAGKIGKDVKLIGEAVGFTPFTSRNFRKNLSRMTGVNPENMQAHHILPQKFRDYFERVGININDPKYGHWLVSTKHNKGSYRYNKAWEDFFKENPNYTEDMVLKKADEIMKKIYGE